MTVKPRRVTATAGRNMLDVSDEVVPVNTDTGELYTSNDSQAAQPAEVGDQTMNPHMESLDDGMQARINSIRTFSDPARGLYYVTQLPFGLRFGYDDMFDRSNFLIRANDNEPVRAWITGRVLALSFVEPDGTWPNSVYISVLPLVKEDYRVAVRVSNEYSKPTQGSGLNPFGTLIANKFQKKYRSDEPATEFKAVWDASENMKQRSLMKHYPAKSLKKGDIVIVESKIKKRFESKDARLSGTPVNKSIWTMGFQLNAVFFLCHGAEPDAVDEGVSYSF